MNKFLLSFKSWIEENYIKVNKLKEEFYEVPGWGTFILIYPQASGLIKDYFGFNLGEREDELIYLRNPDYLVFSFGERFYFSKVKKIKDEEYNEYYYEVKFNDFLYVGNTSYDSTNKNFYPIGIHTEYELLNGSQDLTIWCKKVKFLNLPGVGIADKNTLAGTLPLQVEAKKVGIDFIFGETVSVAYNYDKEKPNQEKYELTLYVKNEKGWKNLLKINKFINVRFNNFVPEKLVLKYSEGLICVFGNNSILNSNYFSIEEKKKLINNYKSYFLSKDVYYQLDSVEYESDEKDLKQLESIKNYLLNLSKDLSCCLINNAYYPEKRNNSIKSSLNKLGGIVSDYSTEQYLKTIEETIEKFKPLFKNKEKRFKDFIKKGVEGTKKIFEDCKGFEIETKDKKIPRYEFAEGETNEELFFRLIREGIEKKLKVLTKEYSERIKKECKVIIDAGLIDYFLIIWDIINYAKRNNILVGPGRGSIAGSLVAFLIDIHSLDSIKYDLMFERFLNETRAAISIPDIDTDFPIASRQRIKEYIIERFGENHVCSIGSYTKLKLKAGLKDFGRLKGLQFGYVNYITSEIKNQLEYDFNDFVRYAVESKDLKEFFQLYPDIISNVKDTMGQAKSVSIHASGVVIVPKKNKKGEEVDLFDWMPIRKMDGVLVSEWEGKYIEKAGFLKEDILGLNQLDKFKTSLNLIVKNRGKKINLEKIKTDDEKVFEFFKKGYNEDVFQFTSIGLKNYSKLVKPDTIDDLIAMNALFRPGPIGSGAHMDFAKIKHGKKEPTYDHPVEERFSKKTFGLYVYQETVMAAVVELAGFTLVESDIFRNAIKHFELKTMQPFKEKFIEGCKIKNKIDKELAEKLWNKIISFSGYGYNKAHAAAYTLISYDCQWLKVHYPLEFWTSSLQHSKDELIPHRINEIKKAFDNINIRLPDVNNSRKEFTCDPVKNNIFWSLLKIKHVGEIVVNKILSERKNNGKFKSLKDFIERSKIKNSGINKRTVQVLILSGAFDILEKVRFPKERLELLKTWSLLYKTPLEEIYTKHQSNSFFIIKAKELTGLGELDFEIMLKKQHEKELQSLYVPPDKFSEIKKEKYVCIAGELINVCERYYKKGGESISYAKLKILCNDDIYSVVVWNETWFDYKKFLNTNKNNLIAITGRVKYSDYTKMNEMQTDFKTQIIKLI